MSDLEIPGKVGKGALRGKKVLVTGASRGIGKATVMAFAAAGADVAVNGRSAERLEPVMAAARKLGVHACPVVGDLGVPEQWAGIIQAAVQGLGGLDILINNGPGMEHKGSSSTLWADSDADEQYESAFRINVRCAAALIRHSAPHLAKNLGGAVVNVSSVVGSVPVPRFGALCVAKAALQMLTLTWALRLAKDKVRVNAIQPSFVMTPVLEQAMQAGLVHADQVAASHPQGRISTAEEQASVITFLASDAAAACMTGAIVPVDGSLMANRWVTKQPD